MADNKILSRFKHAWNIFMGRDSPEPYYKPIENYEYIGPGNSYRPDRTRISHRAERSFVASIMNRIATDAASLSVQHVYLDKDGRYLSTKDSKLNSCLNFEANKDQSGRALIQDIVLSMLDEGVVAVVPVETTTNPFENNSYEIETLRTGKIKTWYPDHVQVELYNDLSGLRETVTVPKRNVAIIENPFYSVMNEPNSTLQRLMRKLSLLDSIDEQSGSGKLDLILQLPYIVKGETRKKQAEERRKDIERQLTGSKYGIAYTDGTEKIVQLNRSVENNLMTQIDYLTDLLYSQLGISSDVMDGTASESVMNNYYVRIIEPIMSAVVDEMTRKFLTKTARTQGQAIEYYRNPFKLISIENVVNVADGMTRNEIMTTNEIRQLVGLRPSSDPGAEELRNKNLYREDEPGQEVEEEQSDVPGNEEAMSELERALANK